MALCRHAAVYRKVTPEPLGKEVDGGVKFAPPTGLEPVTLRLTVECSAN